jgi:hypothetical protein
LIVALQPFNGLGHRLEQRHARLPIGDEGQQ